MLENTVFALVMTIVIVCAALYFIWREYEDSVTDNPKVYNITICIGAIVLLIFNWGMWYRDVSPKPENDTLVEVVSEVSKEQTLCYPDGKLYSKETTSHEIISYADGKYQIYLVSEDEKKFVSRFIDRAQLLEPEFNADAVPKLETVVLTNYYADADTGEKKLFPITETKYRFVLPSEEFWHE